MPGTNSSSSCVPTGLISSTVWGFSLDAVPVRFWFISGDSPIISTGGQLNGIAQQGDIQNERGPQALGKFARHAIRSRANSRQCALVQEALARGKKVPSCPVVTPFSPTLTTAPKIGCPVSRSITLPLMSAGASSKLRTGLPSDAIHIVANPKSLRIISVPLLRTALDWLGGLWQRVHCRGRCSSRNFPFLLPRTAARAKGRSHSQQAGSSTKRTVKMLARQRRLASSV